MSRRKSGCSLFTTIVKPFILKYGRLGFQGASRPSPFSTFNCGSLGKNFLLVKLKTKEKEVRGFYHIFCEFSKFNKNQKILETNFFNSYHL